MLYSFISHIINLQKYTRLNKKNLLIMRKIMFAYIIKYGYSYHIYFLKKYINNFSNLKKLKTKKS